MQDLLRPQEKTQEQSATHLAAGAALANPESARAIISMRSSQGVPHEFGTFSITDAHSLALAEALKQNDTSRRDLVTADAPFHSKGGLAGGKYGHSDKIIPEGVKGVGEWGVIYPELGKTPDRSAKIQVADAAVYYHKKGGGWVVGEAPEQAKWWEGNYYANFHGNLSKHGDGKLQADGSFQFSAPPEGFNDHFGPGPTMAKFDPALYDGVFTAMSVKSDMANSGLVMQLGADYYIPANSMPGQLPDSHSSPAAGGNNWTRITDKWQQLYFTSLDAQTLSNDPPPGLSDGRDAGAGTPSVAPGDTTSSAHGSGAAMGNADHAAGESAREVAGGGAIEHHFDYQSRRPHRHSLDRNGDGQLSLEELLRALLAADKDGNGVLSSNELAPLIAQLKATLAVPLAASER